MANAPLTTHDFTESAEPFDLFAAWLKDAEASEPNDANAMALATVDPDGLPDVRMVLLKGFDRHGFVFYTNLESRKGTELAATMKAALCFHWKSLRRQVRVRGPVERVSDAEADNYYASRPRGSRIALEKAVAEYTARYPLGEIPRPSHWSGFRIVPRMIEFWADRPFRLHDRIVFDRRGGGWEKTRLYP